MLKSNLITLRQWRWQLESRIRFLLNENIKANRQEDNEANLWSRSQQLAHS